MKYSEVGKYGKTRLKRERRNKIFTYIMFGICGIGILSTVYTIFNIYF